MKTCFVFCHGFGFDKNFWDHLKPYFSNSSCTYIDIGYFGKQDLLIKDHKDTEFIGVGHSLGFIKLLNLKIKFKYLIGLNSFVNFYGNAPDLYKKRKYEHKILTYGFNSDPINSLNHFYKRCGLDKRITAPDAINKILMLNELALLSSKYNLPSQIPVLIIASKNDTIVPLSIIFDNFTNKPNVTIKILDDGQHALGLLKTKTIYNIIMNFLDERKN